VPEHEFTNIILEKFLTSWNKFKMSTSIGTRIFTKLFGEEVGQDDWGNKYYRHNYGSKAKEKRWVIYFDEPDGSAVPPNWQGWLTHTSKLPPTEDPPIVWDWMIEHKPNTSGTPQAYRPPGSSLTGHSEISRGSYEPWEPT
tara:strand:+ start:1028 stop:1450 length:423 start_codon:yes stop_codon:yes gene_type:complete